MVYYRHRGFTLIELLVVIGIIGLLSTIVSVALGNARLKARDARRMSDLKQVGSALELYYSEHDRYPEATGVQLGTGNYACLNSGGFAATGCASPFMGNVPGDPTRNIYYIYTGASSTYSVTANLEGVVDGLRGAVDMKPSGIGQH